MGVLLRVYFSAKIGVAVCFPLAALKSTLKYNNGKTEFIN